MARFSTTALALLAAATPFALAFCTITTVGSKSSSSIITNLQMSANAQDQPRTAPSWTKGAASSTLEDDFDAPTPYNPQSASGELDHDPVVDDECYMGADGQFDDCVDFDPPKQTNLWTNVLDTPRGQKSRELPKWAQKK
ncbi:hypothetical protein ACHAWC_005654 [Mediolabrus comicus]